MNPIPEHGLVVLLIQLFVLLTLAHLMGILFRKVHLPTIVGEIFAGIVLGPTLLGRISPQLYQKLFPQEILQSAILETVALLGLMFLLLAAGLEVDVSVIRREGKPAVFTGLGSLLVPIGITFGVLYLFFPAVLDTGPNPLLVALFLGIACAISAMPVVVKILYDLALLKTDAGLISLSAATLNDLLGWLLFTIAFSLATEQQVDISAFVLDTIKILLFFVLSLTLIRKIVVWGVQKISLSNLPMPASILAFIFGLALLWGFICESLGIHAIFGFFLAGVMVGDAESLHAHTRHMVVEIIFAVFAPIFFASIGLKVDFLANFSLFVFLLLLILSMGGEVFRFLLREPFRAMHPGQCFGNCFRFNLWRRHGDHHCPFSVGGRLN